MFTLRDYQTEDVLSVAKAFDGHRAVLGRAATGLGKAVELAQLASCFGELGRVMILVDVGKLVRQLAETIRGHTGTRPGIEMGEEYAINDGSIIPPDRIIVSTVQSQYAGGEGKERFRRFNPDDFSLLLLDECLVGSSRVTMADGSTETIERITMAGSRRKVLSYNEGTGEIEPKWAVGKKRPTAKSLCRVTLENGICIECTPDHPIYTKDGYKSAGALTHEDVALCYSYEYGAKTTGIGNASRRRLYVLSQGEARQAAQKPAVGNWAQYEAGGVSSCKAVNPLRNGGIRAAKRKKWRVGRSAPEIRNTYLARVSRTLQPLLSRREEGCDSPMAGPVGTAGHRVVVYGRRLSQSTGRGNDLNGRFLVGRASCDGEMVCGAMGNHLPHSQNEAGAGALLSAIREARRAQALRTDPAACYSGDAVQTIPGGDHHLPELQSGSNPSEIGCIDVRGGKLSSRGDVKASDFVLPQASGPHPRWTSIQSIETFVADEPVYDLEVEGNHNFFANGMLVHNCETFLAPGARRAVDWYMQNPKLKVFGCSATPFRTDGTPMANLFQNVAFDRDIRWGVDNGWLVKPRQAFVRVSLDFSSLKVRKVADGEADYSADDIAAMFENERPLIEVAKGIIAAAGDRRSIIACPNVKVAKAIAHYLDAERAGSAGAIYGEMSDQEKDDIFEGHAQGRFQFLSSVMMLTKGYDDKNIRAVFNLRKTRSKRLYAQIVGRGTRPLGGTVDGLETPDARRVAIAASGKPDMLMVDLAGVDVSVKDIQLVDILHEGTGDAVRERAKRIALKESKDQTDPDETAKRAETEIAEEKRIEEERERQKRQSVQVQASVEIEYEDDMRVGGGDRGMLPALKDPPSEKMKHLLRAYGVKPAAIERFSRQQAGIVIARMKQKGKQPDWTLARTVPTPNPAAPRARSSMGCTPGQRALLSRKGFSSEQINRMDFDTAIRAINGHEVAA